MALSRFCRSTFGVLSRERAFHSCSALEAAQATSSSGARATKGRAQDDLETWGFEDDLMEDQGRPGDDAPEPAHRFLEQQRQMLHYLRLIEHEMPKLVAYRRPFVPPTSADPLVIRSISYGGEQHPADAKRTIVTPVANLPLKNDQAIHKFKVLAGVRWSPEPPADSGIGLEESGSEHGYFKIACEDFATGPMNLKWASDTLDRLLAEANDLKETFADIPVDTRHIEAKIRKAKKGGQMYGRQQHRPSLRDFPKEWLPTSKPEGIPESPRSA